MKQFKTILKFELTYFFKNKVFMGLTIVLILGVAVLLSFPRIMSMFDTGSETQQKDTSIIAVSCDDETFSFFTEYFEGMTLEHTTASEAELKELVDSNSDYKNAIIVTSPTTFTNIVKNSTMYDTFSGAVNDAMKAKYQHDELIALGADPKTALDTMNVAITGNTVTTGKDQSQTFFYTYVLIFGLYMAIILYGQLVASSVASEKSSRAMELLITSAKPTSLMFGKVFGSGLAGIIQLVAVFGSSFLFFNLNREFWVGNPIINSIFNMPVELLLYALLFFVLGFFMYAFLFGAIGSLASKVEDINTTSMPVMFIFIIAFMIVMFSMSSGDIDSVLMVICSFIPLTSPMAMFARIAMGNVAAYEIVISVVILFLSTIGVGYMTAKIYRMGVLMYGNPPKLSTVIKNLKNK